MLKTIPELMAEARASLNVITAEAATSKIKDTQGIVIDVREPSEFEQKAAKGAINIPRGVLEPQMLQRFPDESLTLFIHCASGVRATLAAEQLKRIGYKNVWVITCNISDVCLSFQ